MATPEQDKIWRDYQEQIARFEANIREIKKDIMMHRFTLSVHSENKNITDNMNDKINRANRSIEIINSGMASLQALGDKISSSKTTTEEKNLAFLELGNILARGAQPKPQPQPAAAPVVEASNAKEIRAGIRRDYLGVWDAYRELHAILEIEMETRRLPATREQLKQLNKMRRGVEASAIATPAYNEQIKLLADTIKMINDTRRKNAQATSIPSRNPRPSAEVAAGVAAKAIPSLLASHSPLVNKADRLEEKILGLKKALEAYQVPGAKRYSNAENLLDKKVATWVEEITDIRKEMTKASSKAFEKGFEIRIDQLTKDVTLALQKEQKALGMHFFKSGDYSKLLKAGIASVKKTEPAVSQEEDNVDKKRGPRGR